MAQPRITRRRVSADGSPDPSVVARYGGGRRPSMMIPLRSTASTVPNGLAMWIRSNPPRTVAMVVAGPIVPELQHRGQVRLHFVYPEEVLQGMSRKANDRHA